MSSERILDSPTTSRHVYGFCGFIGSGKNTAARAIQDKHPFQSFVHSFAAPLKDAVASIFGWDRALLEGATIESRVWREQPDAYWSGVFGRVFTPRTALQEIGTNVFRTYYQDIWIAATAKRTEIPGAHIFTDVRFGNEMDWLHNTGGLCIWIYRENPESVSFEGQAELHALVAGVCNLEPKAACLDFMWKEKAHASETAFLLEGAADINVVVSNTGTAQHLYQMIEHIEIIRNNALTDMPLGTRTLYLDIITDDNEPKFRWQYKNGSTVKWFLYDTHHHLVRVG